MSIFRTLGTSVAVLSLAATASAQSLVGDTFDYNAFGTNLDDVSGTAVVDGQTEFTLTGPNGESFLVDVGPSSVVITADFPPGLLSSIWGTSGTETFGSLSLTGLEYDNGFGIAISGFSFSSGITPLGIFVDGNTLTIGNPVNSNSFLDLFGWADGVSLRVDLEPDPCNAVNLTTGVAFPTIAAAIAASNPGDVIELAACRFTERGLDLTSKGITIRGQGSENTVIDGGGEVGAIFFFNGGNFDRSTIEGVTIRNALADIGNGGAAIRMEGGSLTVRNCVISDHDSNGRNTGAVLADQNTLLRLESCRFDNNIASRTGFSQASDVFVLRTDSLEIVNCQFSGGSGTSVASIGIQTAPALIVNCTFADTTAPQYIRSFSGAELTITNCVFGVGSNAFSADPNTTVVTRSVFQSATGDNINGAPDFVDAANGDYRLAAGSRGIDQGDADAYIASGGGLLDLFGTARSSDDPSIVDTGVGAFSFLDAGAFEFEGSSFVTIELDVNGDGSLDFFDIVAFLSLFDDAAGG